MASAAARNNARPIIWALSRHGDDHPQPLRQRDNLMIVDDNNISKTGKRCDIISGQTTNSRYLIASFEDITT